MTDYHYLAGLVDGEGCIQLSPSNKGKYRKYYPRLSVTNTHLPVLEMLVATYGGAIHGPKFSRQATKPCYDWRITGDKAREVLTKLEPLLIIKKEKAQLVLSGDNKVNYKLT